MSVELSIASVARIAERERQEMLTLHQRYFTNVNPDRFRQDLGTKDRVILMRHDGAIVGFSTMQEIALEIGGRRHVFLFSGDTIVHRAFWQSTGLAGAFGHLMLRMIEQHPEDPLHWLLITKGYRTYRFLPVFFVEFHPGHRSATPPACQEVLDAIAEFKFGAAYDRSSGVISFGGERDRLTDELAEVDAHRRGDPHVAFFLDRNPGYRRGDELACIADISRANLQDSAWRVIRRCTVTWDE